MNEPSVAVVVALTDPGLPRLAESLERFADEAGPLGEVVVVDASGTSEASDLARGHTNLRVVSETIGTLAPQLWRVGLLETSASLVALTTAQMVPARGWLNRLRSRIEESGAAGVGGSIEPGSRLSTTDRAVALLRYSAYFPQRPGPFLIEPPGDNALYRRDALLKVRSRWLDGFHESEVHQALRDRGETLAMADGAVLRFEGGVGLASMTSQRFRHARRYGLGRSSGLALVARLVRIASSPLVPPLLCGRIVRALRVRKLALSPWLTSVPSLLVLATAWAIGEVVGTWPGQSKSPVIHKHQHQPLTQSFRKAG